MKFFVLSAALGLASANWDYFPNWDGALPRGQNKAAPPGYEPKAGSGPCLCRGAGDHPETGTYYNSGSGLFSCGSLCCNASPATDPYVNGIGSVCYKLKTLPNGDNRKPPEGFSPKPGVNTVWPWGCKCGSGTYNGQTYGSGQGPFSCGEACCNYSNQANPYTDGIGRTCYQPTPLCSFGYYYDDAQFKCVWCPMGSKGTGEYGGCVDCPANHEGGGGGAACTPCAFGYGSEVGSETCTWCPFGSKGTGVGTGCQLCPAGTAGGGGGAACLAYEGDTFSAEGAEECSACPDGLVANSAKTACESVAPTAAPTVVPTSAPTAAPTVVPTSAPTVAPTAAPTQFSTNVELRVLLTLPTDAPTTAPTAAPSVAPSSAPTAAPSVAPSSAPTAAPSVAPSSAPTVAPSSAPTVAPTDAPTPSAETFTGSAYSTNAWEGTGAKCNECPFGSESGGSTGGGSWEKCSIPADVTFVSGNLVCYCHGNPSNHQSCDAYNNGWRVDGGTGNQGGVQFSFTVNMPNTYSRYTASAYSAAAGYGSKCSECPYGSSSGSSSHGAVYYCNAPSGTSYTAGTNVDGRPVESMCYCHGNPDQEFSCNLHTNFNAGGNTGSHAGVSFDFVVKSTSSGRRRNLLSVPSESDALAALADALKVDAADISITSVTDVNTGLFEVLFEVTVRADTAEELETMRIQIRETVYSEDFQVGGFYTVLSTEAPTTAPTPEPTDMPTFQFIAPEAASLSSGYVLTPEEQAAAGSPGAGHLFWLAIDADHTLYRCPKDQNMKFCYACADPSRNAFVKTNRPASITQWFEQDGFTGTAHDGTWSVDADSVLHWVGADQTDYSFQITTKEIRRL